MNENVQFARNEILRLLRNSLSLKFYSDAKKNVMGLL